VKKGTIILIGGMLLSGSALAQETYYVSDELTITMRSGESTQHQIIRSLRSGTKLEVSETHQETGYSLARTESGTEGWVLTRFLNTQPAAKQRLEVANNKLEKLTKEVTELRAELSKSNSERSSLDKTSSQLEKENSRLAKELQQIKETAHNAISINADNQKLREKMIYTETALQAMEQQNSVLKDRSSRDWFITGTGVTILGIIIGLLLPKLRLQRKPKWSEL